MTWIRLQASVVGMFTPPADALAVPAVLRGRNRSTWTVSAGVVVKVGEPPDVCLEALDRNDVPAVTYSPTPSRVQYHRRCGS